MVLLLYSHVGRLLLWIALLSVALLTLVLWHSELEVTLISSVLIVLLVCLNMKKWLASEFKMQLLREWTIIENLRVRIKGRFKIVIDTILSLIL